MAAPKGNSFWKVRSKHGRDKILDSPEIMWESAEEFFAWCDQNPLLEIDFRGKDCEQVHLPKMRAYTLEGLCLFLGVNTKYFNDFEDGLKGKRDQKSKDFSEVITRIREVIRVQKFTGAAAGFLNPTIIARDLGLKDKQEIEHSGSITSTTNFSIKRRK